MGDGIETTRRGAATLAAAALVAVLAPAPASALTGTLRAEEWRSFAKRFVTPDGRVVDTGNDGISHSESSGYGLVLAAAAGDRETFGLMRAWARANLAKRADGLFSWKWVPGSGVVDANNATDGDLLIALGLLLAAERWGDASARGEAVELGRAVRRLLVVEHGGMSLLLPGVEGFRRGDKVIVNPSYFVLPALIALDAADPKGDWGAVIRSGLVLLAKARFGRYQLPPDWGAVDPSGAVSLPDGFNQRFGYEAVRVPLYLAMGGYRDPYYFRPYVAYASRFSDGIPAVISLPGDVTGQAAASPGMTAVFRLAAAAAGVELPGPAPAPSDRDDYYSSALTLMTRLAERELGISK